MVKYYTLQEAMVEFLAAVRNQRDWLKEVQETLWSYCSRAFFAIYTDYNLHTEASYFNARYLIY